MEWQSYFENIIEKLLANSFELIIIVILVIVGLKLVNIASKKLVTLILDSTDNIESEKKIKTFRHITISTLDILSITIGSMMIIEKLGINIGPIIAAAGVVGIAVGFGSQRLVEDIISGIIILATDQIRVGDVVQIADKSGLVEQVDLRMVVLRDVSGSVHFIRNGKIDTVTNMTKDFSYYVMDINVAYKEDIESVINVIKQIDENLRQDCRFAENILEPIEVLGLDKFDDSAIIIKARIKTKPIKQWEVGREFNLRLKKKFDELNIEIPFPHRMIYFGNTNKTEIF